MRLCSITFYDNSDHRKRYGPCAVRTDQIKAVITYSLYVIFIYFPLKKS